MSVDLSDLVPNLSVEINAPGSNDFTAATDDEMTTRLQNAFWEVVLDGILASNQYTESDGIVTPLETGTPDLPREFQQLIIYYAGYTIVRNALRDLPTQFLAKAGSVEFETQHAASVLRQILVDMAAKKADLLQKLSKLAYADSYYVDMVIARDESLRMRDTVWTSGTSEWWGL